MNLTVIPLVIRILGTIPEESVKRIESVEIRGQEETIQTLLILARILRRVLET